MQLNRGLLEFMPGEFDHNGLFGSLSHRQVGLLLSHYPLILYEHRIIGIRAASLTILEVILAPNARIFVNLPGLLVLVENRLCCRIVYTKFIGRSTNRICF